MCITALQGRRATEVRVLYTLAAFMGVNTVLFGLMSVSEQVLVTASLVTLLSMSVFAVWTPSTVLISQAASSAGLSQGIATAMVNTCWAVGAVAGTLAPSAIADASSQETALKAVALLCAVAAVTIVAAGIRSVGRPSRVASACAKPR